MANNEINNFYAESPSLWFNVSQTIIFQSFSDIAKARTDVTVTGILLNQNDSSALGVAAEAAFLARRANYRLFVFMTSRLLENAGNALDTIPSYVTRPVDIVETYQNAVALCRAENLTQVFTGYPGSLQQELELFNQMNNSEEQLWLNKDSVANLAKSVIQRTDLYVKEQTRIHDQQVRNSYLYSTVPTSIVLSVFLFAILLEFCLPFYLPALRRVAAIRLPENRRVKLRQRDSTILIAPAIVLILTLASIPLAISQISNAGSSFPWFIAIPTAGVAVVALVMNLWNLFRPSIVSVAISVTLEIVAIVLYLILAVEIWSVAF
jgi:hypothetical protein